jgi:hypothetical protein
MRKRASAPKRAMLDKDKEEEARLVRGKIGWVEARSAGLRSDWLG